MWRPHESYLHILTLVFYAWSDGMLVYHACSWILDSIFVRKVMLDNDWHSSYRSKDMAWWSYVVQYLMRWVSCMAILELCLRWAICLLTLLFYYIMAILHGCSYYGLFGFYVNIPSSFDPRNRICISMCCYEPRKRNDNVLGVLIVISESTLTIRLQVICANVIDRNTCCNVA